MSENPIEGKRTTDREKTVVIAVAVGVGILLILAVSAVIVLALLGPAIGNIFSNVVEIEFIRLGLGL